MPPRARAQSEDPPAGLISTRQMRELHVLLHQHHITGDDSVHDYIARALDEIGADPVESRKDLTTVQAAHLIADLEAAPHPEQTGAPPPAKLRALREPFPESEIGKLPRSTCRACSESQRKRCEEHAWISNCSECGGYHSSATMHIDYVGHADVTARLLAVDPLWTWVPGMDDPTLGTPSIAASLDRDGNLWIKLTVLGVTRYGVGDGKNAKERIGDAIRNAAMRFGVALDLWAKGDRDWSSAAKSEGMVDPPMDPAQRPQHDPSAGQNYLTAGEVLGALDTHAQRLGIEWETFTEQYRAKHGGITLDQMEAEPVESLRAWEQQVAEHIAAHPEKLKPLTK